VQSIVLSQDLPIILYGGEISHKCFSGQQLRIAVQCWSMFRSYRNFHIVCNLQVNGDDLTQASHYHAHQALTNFLPVCRLTVYREKAEDSRPIEKEGKVTRVVILGASCHLCWTAILIVEPICTFCFLSLFPSVSVSLSLHTTCPFCANQQETEIHFVFQCPVYNQLRSKYLADIINVRDPRKHLIILMNSSSQERILNFAKFLACALNLRSSKLAANTWVSPYVDVHRAALQTCVLKCPL